MGVQYNETFKGYRTAKELLLAKPFLLNRDGVYTLCPDGTINSATPVYCDMTTDGGGWMLFARSHYIPGTDINPYTSGSYFASGRWGWLGSGVGSLNDYSQPYQIPWYTSWHPNNNTFTEFIFGNRLNVNNNAWGPFIFKQSLPSYATLMPSSGLNFNGTRSVLKQDLTIYNSADSGNPYPVMQQMYGYPAEGTSANMFFLRDCCGFSGNGAYPGGMGSYYIGHPTLWYLSGPWGAQPGSGFSSHYPGVDSNGNYIQRTGSTQYGGTNQYMIMVR